MAEACRFSAVTFGHIKIRTREEAKDDETLNSGLRVKPDGPSGLVRGGRYSVQFRDLVWRED
jgi:hypothetical protein